MEIERQELGLWLVLEDKKPVVAFPTQEQAERYLPIHVKKREDVPIMEIVHVSFSDGSDRMFIPYPGGVRPGSVPASKPWLPPKLTPASTSKELEELLERLKHYKQEDLPPFAPIPTKWGSGTAVYGPGPDPIEWNAESAKWFSNKDGLGVSFGKAKTGTS